MRPFLLVGCGGSGGVTLQFLLDQLTADLALRGISTVPAAWQFLHVDVPVAPDGVGSGLPPVVTTYRNGSYVGLAPVAGSFAAVAGALGDQLIAHGEYGQLATWHANPNRVAVPIAQGAGQKRAVGRVVTLARLRQVRDGLDAAYRRLVDPGVREELREVTRVVSPGTESLADMPPVVLVVSSMAGGAGASMVLDVCRVLSRQAELDPASTAVFLYTPEVFDGIAPEDRAGVPGNALAMTGELIATQLGAAAPDDQAIFEAVGLGQGRQGTRAPFGRVFPIGGKIGNTGTAFGGGDLNQIYRGVGRGLAALMLSGEATQRWTGFDLTNENPLPVDPTVFGWSAEAKDLQWGSFGFAQLNMGRDRYAEYAAQRLARTAVLQLVQGHRQAGDPGTDQEQRDRVVQDRLPAFTAALGLPVAGQPLDQWFSSTFGSAAWDSALVLVQRHVEPHLQAGPGTPAAQWLSNLQSQVHHAAPTINADAEAEAYKHVFAWYEHTLDAAERAVERALSTYGIPVVVEMLSRLDASTGPLASGMSEGAKQLRRDATAIDPAHLATAQAIKGAIDNRSAVVQTLREGYQHACYQGVFGAVAAKLAEVLAALRGELLEPLRVACGDTGSTLDAEVAADRRGGSLVQLRTAQFAQWPVEGQQVPARFTHAQNEVLLIDASLFADQFDSHLRRTMDLPERRVTTAADAVAAAAREVVLHEWPVTGTELTGRLLEQEVRWRPAALSTEPGSGETVASRRARYRLAANPAELLERAREWVGRPRQPLQEFVNTSLRDYVGAPELSEAVRRGRLEEVARRFRETLELAQPLVRVSADLVRKLHDYEARTAYKFSEVPFDGLSVAEDLRQYLEQSGAHQTSVRNLDKALRATSSATRIDVFGSYAPLAPMAFTSLLKPLAVGWSERVAPAARVTFTTARRSRRLRGAVPMNDRQRQALVAGWYLARYTGRLRLPGDAPGVRAVQVWDPEERAWAAFPDPLVVPQVELDRSPNNYLPAVLLSYGLATAQATALEDLRPLRPYTVLRQYWDDSTSGVDLALDGAGMLSAARFLRAYFADPDVPAGAPAAFSGPLTGDLAADLAAMVARVRKVHDKVGTDYLPASETGAAGGGRWSSLQRVDDLWGVPLFHEVAPDVHWATGRLLEVLAGLAADDVEEEYV